MRSQFESAKVLLTPSQLMGAVGPFEGNRDGADVVGADVDANGDSVGAVVGAVGDSEGRTDGEDDVGEGLGAVGSAVGVEVGAVGETDG